MNLRYPLTRLETDLKQLKVSKQTLEKVEPGILHPELDDMIKQYEEALSVLKPRSDLLIMPAKENKNDN